MAPRKTDPVGGGGEKHGTIEIAYIKLGGNDATLQKVVDAFTTLISRSPGNGHVLQTPKRVNTLPVGTKAAQTGNGTETQAENESIDIEPTEVEDVEEAAPVTPRTPRKYNVPTAIPIDTETGESVRDFVKKYKVDSHEDKYLALAGWLKAQRPTQPLKAGLIVTLYKHLDWNQPADVTMPLRRLSSKDYQWLERKDRGQYVIHQVGSSELAKKLKA